MLWSLLHPNRQFMSPSRQPSPVWRALAKTHLRGRVLKRHKHSDAQLLYAVCGVMQVQTDLGQWTVPPQRALWIPPVIAHEVTMLSDTKMRALYLSPSICPAVQQGVHAMVTSTLMRELILTLFEPRYRVAIHERVVALLLSLIPVSQELPSYLAMPSSPPLLRVAQTVLANRLWDKPVADIATAVHMTERSFTRHFSAEVGMSFRAWRQRARVIASLDRVVAGESSKAVALMSGFNNSSAFVAAFKQVMGITPAQFTDNPSCETR
jgi:AraC-like DNA-binding protein